MFVEYGDIIELSIKFRKGFAKFIIKIALFKNFLHPMGSISLNSFVLLEHLAILLTSTLAINC